MAARTGTEYLHGLRDTRAVWVDGDAVTDVTAYRGFKGSLAGMAGYFDWQHAHADSCLLEDEDGRICNVSHLIPKSREDLARRHEGLRQLARYSVGMLGRTPDYVNVTFAGFAGQPIGTPQGPLALDQSGHGPAGRLDRLPLQRQHFQVRRLGRLELGVGEAPVGIRHLPDRIGVAAAHRRG